ncbi:glycosyltransferase family 4 protein [Methanothrix sp.]|uniref:glycosyltransferase family 4 protein n=1 Tax=Methanothrix sp. TaxID=90426 RepID=UPI0023567412|nr:glycosyltransferase family 4 protein [Methanothrix sp.]
MKIIQVSPYFPPHLGGVEYHVKELADGLAKRGHQVTVASSCGRWNNGFVRIPSIDLFYVPIPIKRPNLEADIYHSHVPSPLFAFNLEADIYHSHVPSPLFAFVLRDSSPHVVTYHNDVVIPGNLNGHYLPRPVGAAVEGVNRKIIRPILDRAKIVISTTKSYAETSPILKDYIHKTKIVPNAVDVSLYPRKREKKGYVLYAGRLLHYKGIESLIQAMSEVQKKADLELVLVGDGYDRSRLEEMARRLDVRARFTGRLDRSRFIDTLSHAEVLVLPTQNRLEAFGIVLLEAMACETPVLAFKTPGVAEVAGSKLLGWLRWQERGE